MIKLLLLIASFRIILQILAYQLSKKQCKDSSVNGNRCWLDEFHDGEHYAAGEHWK